MTAAGEQPFSTAADSGASSPKFCDYSQAELNQLAACIKEFEALFKREFGLDTYLTWGTLLGAVRDTDFIPHDSDVDLAYLSAKSSDFEIAEEHELIVRVLRDQGCRVQRNSTGQIHVNLTGSAASRELPAFNLDVWTTWLRDGRFYHYPDIKGEVMATAITPLTCCQLRGHSLPVPSRPAAMLSAFYGPQWATPDPDYAWYPRYDADDVFEFMRAERVALSLPEYPERMSYTVREAPPHFFVIGEAHNEALRLNASAMLILELCTGENSLADIITLLQQAFALPSAPEVVVLEFLSYAAHHKLIC